MAKVIAIAFGRSVDPDHPLQMVGEKWPVYKDLLTEITKKGYQTAVVSTKDYTGNGSFGPVHADVVYDRSGGIKFPWPKDSLKVVDSLPFKRLAWDKWLAYQQLGFAMPVSYLIKSREEITDNLDKIATRMVVIKPVGGLKGRGLFVGQKAEAGNFEADFSKGFLIQTFIDTSQGIPGIVAGRHDLRLVVMNHRVVWVHVRTPPEDSLIANVAGGGTLTEINLDKLPSKVVQLAQKVIEAITKEFGNQVYSIDMGVDPSGCPWVFEINDQMGFPKPEAIGKKRFINELADCLVSEV